MSFSNNWNRRRVHPGCVSHVENTGIGVHFWNMAPVLNMLAATGPRVFSLLGSRVRQVSEEAGDTVFLTI